MGLAEIAQLAVAQGVVNRSRSEKVCQQTGDDGRAQHGREKKPGSRHFGNQTGTRQRSADCPGEKPCHAQDDQKGGMTLRGIGVSDEAGKKGSSESSRQQHGHENAARDAGSKGEPVEAYLHGPEQKNSFDGQRSVREIGDARTEAGHDIRKNVNKREAREEGDAETPWLLYAGSVSAVGKGDEAPVVETGEEAAGHAGEGGKPEKRH